MGCQPRPWGPTEAALVDSLARQEYQAWVDRTRPKAVEFSPEFFHETVLFAVIIFLLSCFTGFELYARRAYPGVLIVKVQEGCQCQSFMKRV